MLDINNSSTVADIEPYKIREGVYGATFNKNGESLFLRMELITEENTESWTQFKKMNDWVANSRGNGVLSGLVNFAGKANYPNYEAKKAVTGFTEEEYRAFTEEAIKLKKKTDGKIVKVLEANSIGSSYMITSYLGDENYVVYISKNSDFSIRNSLMKNRTLKNFNESYEDILISVGSDFSKKGSFHNRGISRNPHWVFKEKYSGLSMVLHGFTGAVADKYFSENNSKKEWMNVAPIGSMQVIINDHLLPGEGYIVKDGEKVDILSLKLTKEHPEQEINFIKVSALKRIYLSAVAGMSGGGSAVKG